MSSLAIATPEREATEAGVRAFAAGGNAIDAALAAATVLAVTYPHNCGLGGDLFALVRQPSGATTSVNASGPAPGLADADEYRRRGSEMPLDGAGTITVPGVVAGWEELHARGAATSWERCLADAIEYAEEGFAVSSSLAAAIDAEGARIDGSAGMRQLLAPDGRPLREGATLRQPALAGSLRVLAGEGPRALYDGDLARRFADGLARAGALVRADDLAAFAVEATEPLRESFKGMEVLTSPPNSSGVLLLQALAALELAGDGFDPLGHDAAFLAAVLSEGSRQRETSLADPRTAPFDRADWLGEARLAALVRAGREAASRVPAEEPATVEGPSHGDTVAVVAADDSGRAVSLIQSLYRPFGSCVLEPETGIILHNRGSWFSLEPGHPNELAPGRRPAHTLLPVVVEESGALRGVLGTMGGKAHAQIHVQVLLQLLAGHDAQAAVDLPRWIVGGLELGEDESTIRIEEGVPEAAGAALRGSGFPCLPEPRLSEELGHAQAVWARNASPLELSAGSDHRADGVAAVRSRS